MSCCSGALAVRYPKLEESRVNVALSCFCDYLTRGMEDLVQTGGTRHPSGFVINQN